MLWGVEAFWDDESNHGQVPASATLCLQTGLKSISTASLLQALVCRSREWHPYYSRLVDPRTISVLNFHPRSKIGKKVKGSPKQDLLRGLATRCPLHKLCQLSKYWLQRARAMRAGRHYQTHAALCPDSGQVPWRPILAVCSILLLHCSQSSMRAHFCKITFAPVAVHVKLELKAGLQRPKQWDCAADSTPFLCVCRVSCASQDSKMTILAVKHVSSWGRVLLSIFVPCCLSWCRKNEGRKNERSEYRGWRGEKSVDFLLFFQLLAVLTWTSLFHKVQSLQF